MLHHCTVTSLCAAWVGGKLAPLLGRWRQCMHAVPCTSHAPSPPCLLWARVVPLTDSHALMRGPMGRRRHPHHSLRTYILHHRHRDGTTRVVAVPAPRLAAVREHARLCNDPVTDKAELLGAH